METDTELHRSLGRMEGKLDGIAISFAAERAERLKLEGRVSALETKLSYWAGALALFAFILTFLKAKLEALFS